MKKIRWYHSLMALILILGSGAIFALSMRPNLAILGWIAMLPMLLGTRLTKPALAGLFGVAAITLCGWMLVGRASSGVQSANAVFLFLGLGLLFAVVSMLSSFSSRKMSPILWAIFVPCAAVACEWIITYVSPVSTALSLSRNSAALALARYTGIWGVTFLVWLVPASLSMMFARKKPSWPLLIPAIVALLVAYVAARPTANRRVVRVAAIQAQTSEIAADETARISDKADFAVWPEYVLDLRDTTPYDAAARTGLYVVASVREQTRAKKPYNSAVLISPDGERIGIARKRHLYGREVLDFYAGMTSTPIEADGLKVGIAICYDTVFTNVTRDLTRKGAQVVFVPTGDPVVPNFLVHRLHAGMVAFRAAENGVPIVWADANGMSTIFDSYGRIVKQAPIDRESSVCATVGLRRGTTLFMRHGDYFAYICGGIGFALMVISAAMSRPKRRDL